MKISDHLRDRLPDYMTMLFTFAAIVLFMDAFHVNTGIIISTGILFWLGNALCEMREIMRRKSFYDTLTERLEGLDKKYLICEMTDEPDFFEGKLLCDILRETGASMCEENLKYRNAAAEFREFIEMWVHEIKLPLSSLQLMVHNTPCENSDKINEQLRRIDGCTDMVLYYARSENAQKDHMILKTSLKKAVTAAAVKNREDLLLRDIALCVRDLGFTVMTDSKWLEFIIGQLMANSIKFISQERSPEISIWAEELPDKIVLHFRDNGIGIPDGDLPRIFEKTFTGENGRSGCRSTGMGLYIVKSLCERLGHNIQVRSQVNLFTEFEIAFEKNDFYYA